MPPDGQRKVSTRASSDRRALLAMPRPNERGERARRSFFLLPRLPQAPADCHTGRMRYGQGSHRTGLALAEA
jgi:hypothetical protein